MHSGSNGYVGGTSGGAPAGNGTFLLLALAAAYAGRKVNQIRSLQTEEQL